LPRNANGARKRLNSEFGLEVGDFDVELFQRFDRRIEVHSGWRRRAGCSVCCSRRWSTWRCLRGRRRSRKQIRCVLDDEAIKTDELSGTQTDEGHVGDSAVADDGADRGGIGIGEGASASTVTLSATARPSSWRSMRAVAPVSRVIPGITRGGGKHFGCRFLPEPAARGNAPRPVPETCRYLVLKRIALATKRA
jgi:hypothetical protein